MVNLSKDLGFLRIAAGIPALKVADVDFNTGKIIEMIAQAANAGVQVLTFPEMSLTGYTIADLVQKRVYWTRPKAAYKKCWKAPPAAACWLSLGCRWKRNKGFSIVPSSCLPGVSSALFPRLISPITASIMKRAGFLRRVKPLTQL